MDNVMRVSNFTKKYGKFTAVNNISFELNRGEIVGFVGENGAGKSTTIRCITNMLFPTSGSISVLGLDSVNDAKLIKSKITYLPGEIEFYKGITAKELFKLNSYFEPASFAEAIQLSEYFGLNTEKKVSALSLGNRKKVAIVLTLMRDSELIIMDEPTSGLDPLIQSKFFRIVLEMVEKGKTVFLSSHNLSDVEKYCHRVLIIKDGEIVDNIDMTGQSMQNGQICRYVTKDGEEHSFAVKEDINNLIRKLSKLQLKSLEIRDKSVEENLLHYYGRGETNE